MKNVSRQFEKTMAGRRDFMCAAEITFRDGAKKQLGMDDFGLSGNQAVESPESSSFPIGTLVSKRITLCLKNYDDRWSDYDFQWAKISLRTEFLLEDGTTETINMGNYTVITPESYGTTVEVSAMDDSYKLDREYATSLPYPASLGAALRDSCSTCGVSLLTGAFSNSDFVVQQQPEGITHRQFVAMCAMIAGGNARFDGYNRLEIVTYDLSKFEEAGLDGGEFDPGSNGKYATGDSLDGGSFSPWNAGGEHDGGTFGDRRGIHVLYAFNSGLKIETDDVIITGVKLKGEDETEYLYGEEGYVLSLENSLAAGKYAEAARLIGEEIVGLRFRPFSGDHVAYPLAEFGDLALLVDWKNNAYQTVITDVDFSYFGFTSLKCSADSPIRNSSKYLGEAAKVATETKKMVEKEKTERELALEQLANELAQSSGLFMTKEQQPDGSDIYYMHDKPTLEESMIVWKFTAEAFGISTDGGETYPYGLDVTGMAILNRIYAIGINCDFLTTGAFQIKKGNKTMVLMDKDTGQVILRPDVFELSDGKTIESIAAGAAGDAVDGQTQEDIFNRLTNNGEVKGIILKNGELYINATYINTGELSADRIKGGELAIEGTVSDIKMTGKKLSFNSEGEEYGRISFAPENSAFGNGINITSQYGGVIFTVNTSSRGLKPVWTNILSVYSQELKAQKGYDHNIVFHRGALFESGLRSSNNLTVEGNAIFNAGIHAENLSTATSGTNLIVTSSGSVRMQSTSSTRYKDVKREMRSEDVEDLYNISPVIAKYKDGYLEKGDERDGVYYPMFIAEDVEQHIPSAAIHGEDGKTENWDARVMVPAMFQMIKSQKEEIGRLEGKVDALEKMMERGLQ